MKILLDECVTKHLKPYLIGHDVLTVREMQWGGIKNGKLMSLCVLHNFDMLLTIDKNIQFQQAIEKYPLIIIILNCFSSNLEELLKFLPSFNNQIGEFEKYKAYFIKK